MSMFNKGDTRGLLGEGSGFHILREKINFKI